jgi:hypothetical protein
MNIEVVILAGVVVMMVVVVVAQSLRLKKLETQKVEADEKPKPLKISQPTEQELDLKLKQAYETKITEATQTFGQDLTATSKRLSEQVSRLTTTVIEEELDAYQKTLEEVRKAATQAMDQIHQAVEHQRVELRQGMEQELESEKKVLTDKFDAKMGDVVASYMSEALGSGVDLGSQMKFILQSLESHKEDIRKDLLNGV